MPLSSNQSQIEFAVTLCELVSKCSGAYVHKLQESKPDLAPSRSVPFYLKTIGYNSAADQSGEIGKLNDYRENVSDYYLNRADDRTVKPESGRVSHTRILAASQQAIKVLGNNNPFFDVLVTFFCPDLTQSYLYKDHPPKNIENYHMLLGLIAQAVNIDAVISPENVQVFKKKIDSAIDDCDKNSRSDETSLHKTVRLMTHAINISALINLGFPKDKGGKSLQVNSRQNLADPLATLPPKLV